MESEWPYLTIVSMIQDEREEIVREWIAFHETVGVEHFWLYDNDSKIPLRDTLADLPNVSVSDFPGSVRQIYAWEDGLKHAPGKWLAFIDTDEFLFSPTYQPLPTVLAEFEPHEAVGACWLTFGTSGHEEPQPSTLRAYTRRTPDDAVINRHIKSIVQRERVLLHRPENPHYFQCETVNEQHIQFPGPFSPAPSWDLLRIHHYWTRSLQEAEIKWDRKRPDVDSTRRVEGVMRPDHPHLGEVFDDTILPYADLVEARLRCMARAPMK